MKFETYIKNRTLFESRYKIVDMDYSYIEPMMKGIINRNLFFKLYGFDKKFILSMMVSSLDKYKRYSCRQGIGSRIKLLSNKSMFDLFSGEFERVLKHIT